MSFLHNIYAPIFAHIYDGVMAGIENRTLTARRQELLAPLEGKILEVGSGTGINFRFYNSNAQVFALEPSQYMWKKANYRLETEVIAARIHPLACRIGTIDRSVITPASLDVVVCTLVLCSVPDLAQTLATIQSLLKPGGRLILLEHIHSHQPNIATLQNICNPFWRLVSDGCSLTRKTDIAIRSFCFYPERQEYFLDTLTFFQAECFYQP